jgi:diaminohydroxyphosphoribosylaminopyrimidine deaminase / 5-amino-6-(5-phosphoribosylamino)uracil reductase
MYITLEPCSSHGRTPPCSDALIHAELGRVVIGSLDPNPVHNGRAAGLLSKSKMEVITGVLGQECRDLNPAFNKWIVTRMPLVIAKAAMTLDGKLTRRESRWITSVQARRDVHQVRSTVDAILIGAETLRRDNPKLTVRGIQGVTQPWRVVLTRSGDLPRNAHVFTDRYRERTLVFKDINLRSVLRELGEREITSVLIEGGARILGEAFDERLVDRIRFYIAPLISGGSIPAVGGRGAGATSEGLKIINAHYKRIGQDLCLMGDVESESTQPA